MADGWTMNEFRTEYPRFQSPLQIAHSDRMLCTGSCFAEHIGGRLRRLKFPVLVNPFGILYNPVSIAQALEILQSGAEFQPKDLFEAHGLWHSFAHHGRFSHPEKEVALAHINHSLLVAREFLSQTTRLIVTLGTANVFVFKKSGDIVANCHKLPGQEFERRRLSVVETVQALVPVFEKLRQQLPSLQIIATVSPVRHLRDGLTENQRSKATLLLALEEIARCFPFVHYFPAYEILLDDLRDYRFYETDMAHPNQQAVDYIWEYFAGAFFDEKTRALCQRIERVVTAAAHRPFHPQFAGHQAFLKKQLEETGSLEQEFPGLDFGQEREVFEGKGR